MELCVSPAIWQYFISGVPDEIPDRKHQIAIMNDWLVHCKAHGH